TINVRTINHRPAQPAPCRQRLATRKAALAAEGHRRFRQNIGERLDRADVGPFGGGMRTAAIRAEHDAWDAGALQDGAIGPERFAAPRRPPAELGRGNAIERGNDRLTLGDLEGRPVQTDGERGPEVRITRSYGVEDGPQFLLDRGGRLAGNRAALEG